MTDSRTIITSQRLRGHVLFTQGGAATRARAAAWVLMLTLSLAAVLNRGHVIVQEGVEWAKGSLLPKPADAVPARKLEI